MGEISFGIYPLKGTTREAQFENSKLFTAKLRELWKELPPSLGIVHPDSLSPILRRRTIELRVSCNHAIVLANRPYLLGRSDADTRGLGSDEMAGQYAEQGQKAVHAARTVANLWAKVAEEHNVFGAFWIIHHAVFSAVSVLYLYIILSIRTGPGLSESDEEVFVLAQKSQRLLTTATAVNRMCIRYCSILEELREEATKQLGSSGTNTQFFLGGGEHQALYDPSNNHPARLGTDLVIAVSDDQLRSTAGTREDGELIGDWSIFDSLVWECLAIVKNTTDQASRYHSTSRVGRWKCHEYTLVNIGTRAGMGLLSPSCRGRGGTLIYIERERRNGRPCRILSIRGEDGNSCGHGNGRGNASCCERGVRCRSGTRRESGLSTRCGNGL
jgi:hypothetical protein